MFFNYFCKLVLVQMFLAHYLLINLHNSFPQVVVPKRNYQLEGKLIYQGLEHIDHSMLFYRSILQKYIENFLLYHKNVLLCIPNLSKIRSIFNWIKIKPKIYECKLLTCCVLKPGSYVPLVLLFAVQLIPPRPCVDVART